MARRREAKTFVVAVRVGEEVVEVGLLPRRRRTKSAALA